MIAPRLSKAASALLVGLTLSVAAVTVASAQEPPSKSAQEIAFRQATMKVLAGEFGPLGATAAGKIPYDAARDQLLATRVAVIAGIAAEAFPADSASGAPTKAKAEIWTDTATFAGLVKDLQDKTAALATASKAGTLDALKPAVGDVGKACKACHDKFKDK